MLLALIYLSSSADAHQGHHLGEHNKETKLKEAQPAEAEAFGLIQRGFDASVRPVFEQKCNACHANGAPLPWYGKVPGVGWIVNSDRDEAKEHLETSKGFPFGGHGTPLEDLSAIEEVARDASMPPRLYRFFHPSSQLTDQEKMILIQWSRAGQEALKSFKKN